MRRSRPELDVILLCGGYGSRMGQLTKRTQKVMLPFRGKPILQYGVESVIEAFGRVNLIIAIAYLGYQIKEYFGPEWRGNKITYIPHPEGSEDRGALKTVRETLSGGPFIVIHGNIIYEPKALTYNYEHQLSEEPIATLSLAKQSDESKHALVELRGYEISKIAIPDPQNPDIDLATFGLEIYDNIREQELIKQGWLRDMGINSYTPKIFKLIEKYTTDYMAHMFWILVSEFNRGANIGAVVYDGEWLHFQEPKDLVR